MGWMGTCHSQGKSVSLQRPQLWSTDSSSAIICLSPTAGRFGAGAGAQHISGFGNTQEGPGPCDGDTPRSLIHPRTSSGPHNAGMDIFGEGEAHHSLGREWDLPGDLYNPLAPWARLGWVVFQF